MENCGVHLWILMGRHLHQSDSLSFCFEMKNCKRKRFFHFPSRQLSSIHNSQQKRESRKLENLNARNTKSNFLCKLLLGNWVKSIFVLIFSTLNWLAKMVNCSSRQSWQGRKNVLMKQLGATYGSGVCIGEFPWRTYCVLWKMRKANEARKSRDVNKPAAGRNVKPVFRRKKSFISCNCGRWSSMKIPSRSSFANTWLYSRQACFGINSLTTRNTEAHVLFSVSVYTMLGIGSPLLTKNIIKLVKVYLRYHKMNLLFVCESNFSNVLPASSVFLVSESWMVQV